MPRGPFRRKNARGCRSCSYTCSRTGNGVRQSWGEPAIIHRHGTVYSELLLQHPDIETLYVPIGSGSGTILVQNVISPGVRIVGVQSAGASGCVPTLAFWSDRDSRNQHLCLWPFHWRGVRDPHGPSRRVVSTIFYSHDFNLMKRCAHSLVILICSSKEWEQRDSLGYLPIFTHPLLSVSHALVGTPTQSKSGCS